MPKSVRNYTLFVVVALCGIAGAIALKFAPAALKLRDGAVIRRPNRGAVSVIPAKAGRHGGLLNIAPFATVEVSSSEPANGQTGEGVADGAVDTREWMTSGPAQGAWIRLTWDRAVTIAEVELYDRRDLFENVLGGALLFDDGSVIPVPPLPPDGTPWSIRFPPRPVQWVTFRIDSAQGRNPGLAEIMVYGTLNP